MVIRLSAVAAASVLLLSAAASPTWTAEQDHQNMMDQLHITALRPGPSGDPKAPNHANYDEAKANPFPDWPDPLTTRDGRKVTTAAQWWQVRRPEIVEAYSREVYGRVPDHVPAVDWRVVTTDHEAMGFPLRPVVARQVIGHVDNSGDPAIAVDIRMMVVRPADAKGPVPMLIMFGKADFPAPRSCDRRTVLPSMAICFTPRVVARACIQPRKHAWKAAGLIRANTRRKVSFDGMPPGSPRKVCNQSAFFRP